jgi:hypothetical protein
MLIEHAYLSLSFKATDRCGGPAVCRGAYGVLGAQCLAIAQSAFYSGFGSFEGRELTRKDAEATALENCEQHVGQPGQACSIVISACPPGVGD